MTRWRKLQLVKKRAGNLNRECGFRKCRMSAQVGTKVLRGPRAIWAERMCGNSWYFATTPRSSFQRTITIAKKVGNLTGVKIEDRARSICTESRTRNLGRANSRTFGQLLSLWYSRGVTTIKMLPGSNKVEKRNNDRSGIHFYSWKYSEFKLNSLLWL